MANVSDEKFDWAEKREAIIGLGDRSLKKSYYPELKRRLKDLELFRLMLDHSGDGVVLLEIPSWNVVDFNRCFQQMLLLDRDDVLGQNFFKLARIDPLFEELNEGLESFDDRSLSHNCKITDQEGRSFYVEINVNRTRVLGRTLAIAVMRDISKRLQTEKALVESERRYRSYINESPTGIYVTDMDGVFVDVNPAACELSGYSREELMGMTLKQVTHPEDFAAVAEEFLELGEGGSFRNTRRFYTKSGKLQYIDVNAVGIEDGFVMAYCTDVTPNKQAEAELCKAKEVAEAASRAKDDFIAVLSHEMRTPLNPILGFASLMQDLVEDEELLNYIDTIIRSANTQLSLIDQLLSFTRLSKGSLKGSLDRIDPVKMCRDLLSDFMHQAKDLELRFENGGSWDELPDGLQVVCDSNLLHQLLSNLIGNACKYTREGWVCLSLGMRQENADRVKLRYEVRDTGIGIPAEQIPGLFNPFTQVDMSTTREYGGVGLGLAICKRIMDHLGGSISVESTEGEGSAFWFVLDLPVVIPKKISQDNSSKKKPKLERSIKVLIVEDSADNAAVADTLVTHLGGESRVVVNGKLALEACREESFDLILMDLFMPVMNGFEASESILNTNNLNQRTPIIALTANAAWDTKRRCREIGMRDCIQKPIDLKGLYSVIRQL